MSSKETEGLLAGSVEQAYLENRSAGGKRRTEALGALQAMYVFQFCGSLAYGMWAVISPYFLEARGYSTVGAANMYTMAWVAYNVGQIIMSPIAGDIADGHGRRPVFLASAFVVTIFFLTFVYPASWWWVTGSFFQGAADVSWGLGQRGGCQRLRRAGRRARRRRGLGADPRVPRRRHGPAPRYIR